MSPVLVVYFKQQSDNGIVEAACMLNRINWLLNIIMGSSAGVFIGHGIYVYRHYRKYPDLYRTYSAPWYTSIFFYGAMLFMTLAVCLILKAVIQKKMKR